MVQRVQTLVIATANPHKAAEFGRIWRGLPLELRTLASFPGYEPAAETADSYEANATLKAKAAAKTTGMWAVADDSGIEVAALGGRPGVLSARYGGQGLDDVARRRLLLDELGEVPEGRRQANFVCSLVLCRPSGEVDATAWASLSGVVTRLEAGGRGFGYDPVFWVPWLRATLAEVPVATKDMVSHRARAADLLRGRLWKLAGLAG